MKLAGDRLMNFEMYLMSVAFLCESFVCLLSYKDLLLSFQIKQREQNI